MVSVVVPVYNVEKYIRHCLDSLVNQKYRDLQIILIDDGSEDHSGDICDEYAHSYSNIEVYHKENGGLSEARNYGMQYATGEWLSFVDSDDIVSLEFFDKLLYAAKEDCLDIVVADYFKVPEKQIGVLPKEKGRGNVKVWKGIEGTKELLYQKSFTTSAWGKIYKTLLFKNISFPVGKLHEDVGTIYKVFEKAQRIGYLERKLYYYLQRDTSIIHTQFNKRKMDYIYQTKEMVDYYGKNDERLLSAAISRHFSACFQIIQLCPRTSEWMEEYAYITKEINKYASEVLNDRKARVKNRFIAILAVFNTEMAIRLCKLIYKYRS